MKTYTFEEAQKLSIAELLVQAKEDDVVVESGGDRFMLTTVFEPHGLSVEDDPYTAEEMAVFEAFAQVSVNTSQAALREMYEL